MNVGSIDGSSHGQGSKAASLSCVGSQPPWTSISTSVGGSAFGSSRSSCRPWERGDLLKRLATFAPLNWSGKPQVWTDHGLIQILLYSQTARTHGFSCDSICLCFSFIKQT